MFYVVLRGGGVLEAILTRADLRAQLWS